MNEFDSRMDSKNDPLRSLFREQAMEKAPGSLVEGVMSAIVATSANVVPYKPLISRKGWILLGLGFLLLCALPFVIGETSYESSLASGPIIEWISRIKLPDLGFQSISTPFLTGIFAFGVFGLLHLYWLKRQLDQKVQI